MGMLRTQEMMMQVSYPLSAGIGHIQIFQTVLDVPCNAIPEKGGVFINNVSRRRISKLCVHSDLFQIHNKAHLPFVSIPGFIDSPKNRLP